MLTFKYFQKLQVVVSRKLGLVRLCFITAPSAANTSLRELRLSDGDKINVLLMFSYLENAIFQLEGRMSP